VTALQNLAIAKLLVVLKLLNWHHIKGWRILDDSSVRSCWRPRCDRTFSKQLPIGFHWSWLTRRLLNF